MRCNLAAVACWVVLSGSLAEAQYADLNGRIEFKGQLTERILSDARLRIGPSHHGIADVLVYLRKPGPIHPALQAAPREAAVLVAEGMALHPAAMVVRCGQPVEFRNRDKVPHQLHVDSIMNPGCSVLVGFKPPADQLLDTRWISAKPELVPVRASCDTTVRPELTSYWLIVDHPYATVTNDDGEFRIQGLPVGKQTLTIWHNTTGYVVKSLDVDVATGGTTLEPLRCVASDDTANWKLVPVQ